MLPLKPTLHLGKLDTTATSPKGSNFCDFGGLGSFEEYLYKSPLFPLECYLFLFILITQLFNLSHQSNTTTTSSFSKDNHQPPPRKCSSSPPSFSSPPLPWPCLVASSPALTILAQTTSSASPSAVIPMPSALLASVVWLLPTIALQAPARSPTAATLRLDDPSVALSPLVSRPACFATTLLDSKPATRTAL